MPSDHELLGVQFETSLNITWSRRFTRICRKVYKQAVLTAFVIFDICSSNRNGILDVGAEISDQTLGANYIDNNWIICRARRCNINSKQEVLWFGMVVVPHDECTGVVGIPDMNVGWR